MRSHHATAETRPFVPFPSPKAATPRVFRISIALWTLTIAETTSTSAETPPTDAPSNPAPFNSVLVTPCMTPFACPTTAVAVTMEEHLPVPRWRAWISAATTRIVRPSFEAKLLSQISTRSANAKLARRFPLSRIGLMNVLEKSTGTVHRPGVRTPAKVSRRYAPRIRSVLSPPIHSAHR